MIFSNKMVFFLSNLEKLEYRKYNVVLILLFKIAKLVLSLSFPHTPPFEDPKILPRAVFGCAAHTKKRAAQKKQHKTKKTTTQHNTTQHNTTQQQQQQQLRRQQPASLRRLVSVVALAG